MLTVVHIFLQFHDARQTNEGLLRSQVLELLGPSELHEVFVCSSFLASKNNRYCHYKRQTVSIQHCYCTYFSMFFHSENIRDANKCHMVSQCGHYRCRPERMSHDDVKSHRPIGNRQRIKRCPIRNRHEPHTR